jgi:hypothetical protein
MSTPEGTRWYLASSVRLTTLAIFAALGSVLATGWWSFLLSLASVGLAIAGTFELGHARQRRANMRAPA